VIFDDTGELLPGGAFIAPHRPTDLAAFYRPAGVAPGYGGQASAALSVISDISQSRPRVGIGPVDLRVIKAGLAGDALWPAGWSFA
jgi:hypothetical protein